MGWCLGSRGLDRHWFGAEFDPTDWPFDDQAAAQVLFFFSQGMTATRQEFFQQMPLDTT